MELRSYQVDAIEQIEGELAFGAENVCLAAPTSFGKTITAAHFIRDQVAGGQSVVFMMNLTALVEQTAKTLDLLDIKYNVLAASYKGPQHGPGANVTIAMQQTLNSRIDTVTLDCDVLVVDEYHLSFGSETMKKVISHLQPEQIVGLSGTPVDEKGFALKDTILVETATTKTLTEGGYLTPVKTVVCSFSQKVDLSDGSGDWTESELDGALNNDGYNQGVVDAWLEVSEYKIDDGTNTFYLGEKLGDLSFATIGFVSGIDHAEALAEAFTARGVPAFAYHSKLSKKQRDILMGQHKRGVFPVLVSVMALAVGYDFPEIRYGLGCRPTKVMRLYLQMVGRIMRLASGKEEAVWIDAAKSTETHGLYDIKRDFGIHTKALLKTEIAKNAVPEMNYITESSEESTVEVSLASIEDARATLVSDESLEGLLAKYDVSQNMEECLVLASKINHLIGGVKINDSTISWILETVQPAVDSFGIKPFKTRLKNIIKQGKKPAGLRYFPEWLANQRNF